MEANRHLLLILFLGTSLIGSAYAGGYGQTNIKPPPPKDLPPPPPAPEGKLSKPKSAIKAQPLTPPVNLVVKKQAINSLCKPGCE
jgi:hypothetical protein